MEPYIDPKTMSIDELRYFAQTSNMPVEATGKLGNITRNDLIRAYNNFYNRIPEYMHNLNIVNSTIVTYETNLSDAEKKLDEVIRAYYKITPSCVYTKYILRECLWFKQKGSSRYDEAILWLQQLL